LAAWRFYGHSYRKASEELREEIRKTIGNSNELRQEAARLREQTEELMKLTRELLKPLARTSK